MTDKSTCTGNCVNSYFKAIFNSTGCQPIFLFKSLLTSKWPVIYKYYITIFCSVGGLYICGANDCGFYIRIISLITLICT